MFPVQLAILNPKCSLSYSRLLLAWATRSDAKTARCNCYYLLLVPRWRERGSEGERKGERERGIGIEGEMERRIGVELKCVELKKNPLSLVSAYVAFSTVFKL
jgi:hypothetical protein